jgi:hypothetical protein
MKAGTLIIIISLTLIAASIWTYYFVSEEIRENAQIEIAEHSGSSFLEKPETSSSILNDSVFNGSNSSGASGGSSSSGGAGGSSTISQIIPEGIDPNSQECGLYFESYGICGGKCPSGSCVSEARSCYCKD